MRGCRTAFLLDLPRFSPPANDAYESPAPSPPLGHIRDAEALQAPQGDVFLYPTRGQLRILNNDPLSQSHQFADERTTIRQYKGAFVEAADWGVNRAILARYLPSEYHLEGCEVIR
jgi:hypothetical protein